MEKAVVVIEPEKKNKILRVAAYCRVSSDSEDQLHSFASQVQYYTNYIKENKDMELVDIYADEGITGTDISKRDDFKRLVSDCRKGRIDRVITKSISRFSRNTVDAIMYARELKESGVSILFEKENIDTAYLSSEMLLAISGAQAQEESISISKNMRWSSLRRMKDGTYLSSSTPYGYEIKDGKYSIVEKEAEDVRLIFQSYISGMNKRAIVDMLNNDSEDKLWKITSVNYILKNERYVGDALFQKGYTTESLPFLRKPNKGEKAQYYAKNVNPPIISREVFDAAQKLLKKKSKPYAESKKFILTQKIQCKCGSGCTAIFVNGKQYWECKAHNTNCKLCDSHRILEKDIYNAFVTMVNKLVYFRDEILDKTIKQSEVLQNKNSAGRAKIWKIDKEIAELSNKTLVLTRLSSKGILRPSEFAQQSADINNRISKLRKERRRLFQEQDEDGNLTGLQDLYETIEKIKEPITDFDSDLFLKIVKKIKIVDDTTISFVLIGNLSLKEKIPYESRVGKNEK